MVRQRHSVVAVRGDRLALSRVEVGTTDVGAGAPQDDMLRLIGLDAQGRIALLLWFDSDDLDAAIAELDAAYARQTKELDNACVRVLRRVEVAANRDAWDVEQILVHCEAASIGFPFVAKPDLGCQGNGVQIIASASLYQLQRGAGLQGLLGSDIWNQFGKITIDYAAGTLTVSRQIADTSISTLMDARGSRLPAVGVAS